MLLRKKKKKKYESPYFHRQQKILIISVFIMGIQRKTAEETRRGPYIIEMKDMRRFFIFLKRLE